MSDFDKNPTDAATRKPDEVGTPGAPAVGGGHQTSQQAEITGQGSGNQEAGGRTDADRKADWDKAGNAPGRNPTPFGGSSDGQSDRKR